MQVVKFHPTISKKVENYKDIEDEVEALKFFFDKGEYGPAELRQAWAWHHSQVSTEPFNFFILNKDHWEKLGFKSRVIINPSWEKIVINKDSEKEETVPQDDVQEGCMSFPYRTQKYVKRYMAVAATYQYPNEHGALITESANLITLAAQIFQHECDHAIGKNIYFPKP